MTKVSRALLLSMLLGACGRVPNPEYQAACHGPPLGTVEARQQAFEQGYAVNNVYDCIDRKSWEAVQRAVAMVDSAVAKAADEVKQAEKETAAAANDRIRRG